MLITNIYVFHGLSLTFKNMKRQAFRDSRDRYQKKKQTKHFPASAFFFLVVWQPKHEPWKIFVCCLSFGIPIVKKGLC